ncbi:MAG TPA: hypothetical protein QGG52_00810, partial [SAR86 cluster bacterium]|nr:hypothetical protein [SAR86 cluster bacterium]
MDMPLEGLHTATGPGVIEAAIIVDEALASADKASLFKTFTKVLAQRNGLMANFMAKWSELYPGQSGHIHTSLLNLSGQPIFASEESGVLQEEMLFFIGGLQKYMRELSVMIAPTVNSYNRLCPGAWAPINMTWGLENRTTAFRVIQGGPSSQRIENRLGGADANPYLALAATLGAGLLGIEEKIYPNAPIKGGAYDIKVSREHQVPTNLGEGAELFYKSKAARSLFGDMFVDHFSDTRTWEYSQYKKERKVLEADKISNWELSRYFEIIEIMRTGLVFHELYLWHHTGNHADYVPYGFPVEPLQHVESPETKRRIKNLLEVTGLLEKLVPIKPRKATREEILLFHTENHFEHIKSLNETINVNAGISAPTGIGSFDIALLSTGGVLEAMDRVIDGKVNNAYALVRPPGHHAIPDRAMGFCLFGNAAIAGKHALSKRGLSKIAYVDWDVHHG